MTPSPARSNTVARCPAARQPDLTGVVEAPSGAAVRPRPRKPAQAVLDPVRRAGQQEREAREAGQPVAERRHRRAPGAASRSTVDAEPVGLEQHRQRADQPGHAHVLGRDRAHRLAASSASSRTSPASRSPRSSNDGKNRKSGRIAPSRQQPSTSTCPAAACGGRQHALGAADAERRQRRRPVAAGQVAADDRDVVAAGGPAHAPQDLPGQRPRARRPCRAARPGAAPMAARSLTLARTAAMPAPYGSAATNAGRIASPPTTTEPAPSGSTAPSSPGPGVPVAAAEHVGDQADVGLGQHAGQARAGRSARASRQIGHGAPPVDRVPCRRGCVDHGERRARLPRGARSAPRKPRRHGITHVLDKGLPVGRRRAAARASAGRTSTSGSSAGAPPTSTPGSREKLAAAAPSTACSPAPAARCSRSPGTRAWSTQYLDWAAGVGFPCVEVSCGVAPMAAAEKRGADRGGRRALRRARRDRRQGPGRRRSPPRPGPPAAAADLDAGRDLGGHRGPGERNGRAVRPPTARCAPTSSMPSSTRSASERRCSRRRARTSRPG